MSIWYSLAMCEQITWITQSKKVCGLHFTCLVYILKIFVHSLQGDFNGLMGTVMNRVFISVQPMLWIKGLFNICPLIT